MRGLVKYFTCQRENGIGATSMKRHMTDHFAAFLHYPGRKGIGRRKELFEIGGQVFGVPVKPMNLFRYSNATWQINLGANTHRHEHTITQPVGRIAVHRFIARAPARPLVDRGTGG